MKKILVISPFFYPATGGSQRYMEEIYTSLIKLHPEFEVEVLCYNSEKANRIEIYRGLKIHRIPAFSILPDQFLLPDLFSLLKFLISNRNKYELIHCSTRFFDSSWWGPVYGKITGAKTILTDHCADFPVHKNKLITLFAKLLDFSASLIFLNFYDKIFTTNKSAQNFLKKVFRKKSELIYGGINPDIFYPAKRNYLNRFKILFAGRMITSKGPQILFEVAKNIPQADFVFAGGGPLESVFKERIRNEKIKNIEVLGNKNRRSIAELMQESDVLVHPSLHNEGFPNVLTESGACKLAVIATNVGGTKEIIINEKTGILVMPNDRIGLEKALRNLLADDKLRNNLSKNLYYHVTQNFNWEKSAEILYSEIQKLPG